MRSKLLTLAIAFSAIVAVAAQQKPAPKAASASAITVYKSPT
jgi:hypothetical protein